MYCKNCGSVIFDEKAEACSYCGTKMGVGSNFCANCGAKVTEDQKHCTMCGYKLKEDEPVAAEATYAEPLQATIEITKDNKTMSIPVETVRNTTPVYSVPVNAPKSKLAAGLLAIFLGQFGVHNFYLGYTSKAIVQLVLTIVGYITACFVIGAFIILGVCIWGVVEGILILTGSIATDAKGIPLKE